MKTNILHDLRFVEKVLNLTSDTLFLIDHRDICVDFIMKTNNPVFNPEAQLIGKNLLELLPDTTARLVKTEIERCRETGEGSNVNYDLPTGEQMYYFKFIIHKFDDEYLLCQYRDITQRSNMKRRLQSAMTALLEVGRVAMIGIWSFDVLKEEFAHSGYSNFRKKVLFEQEYITLADLLLRVHPDDKQKMRDFLLHDRNEYGSFEYRLTDSETDIQYVQSTKYSKRFENNRWIIEGFTQNISNFIKNRSELEMVLSVVFNVPYAIYASRMDGTMVFANKECRQQNKIPDTMVVTHLKAYDIIDGMPSKETWERFIEKLQQENGVLVYRCGHANPEMNILGSECSSFIFQNGIGEDIVWTMRRDISDQLRYEEQLLKSKEAAEESEKLKSSFISNMNHEIRTPLSAIIGFSSIIAETQDPHLRKEYGQILCSNSSQLLRLVTDVLEMSNMEEGKVSFIPSPISLNNILHELELSYGQSQDMPHLFFEIPQEDMIVNFDRARIVQLLTNLINNAIKFTPPNKDIRIGYTWKETYLEFYVKDAGIGIPKDKQEAIFNRFFKINDADKGTGLGLAICKGIVEQMEGKIWVESEEGKGSTFRIQLPLHR